MKALRESAIEECARLLDYEALKWLEISQYPGLDEEERQLCTSFQVAYTQGARDLRHMIAGFSERIGAYRQALLCWLADPERQAKPVPAPELPAAIAEH
jgi:hypothetical protein